MNPRGLNPQDYIAKWGGKIGGYHFLKDTGGFNEFLPYADFMEPDDEDWGRILRKPQYRDDGWSGKFERYFIVRGSHPNDHEGLVDAIGSVRNIRRPDEMKGAVEKIRRDAKAFLTYSYNKYEGQPYDGRIRIMIAEQLMEYYKGTEQLLTGSRFEAQRGSVIEHPHQRGTYVVEIVTPPLAGHFEYMDRFVVKNQQVVCHHDEMDEQPASVVNENIDLMKKLGNIIDLYQLVEFSEFIPPETSFQMEFGYTDNPYFGKSNVQFFQARPFKKFQEPTFELGDPNQCKYLCFGMTPKEGIELPVRIHHGNNEESINNDSGPYALGMERNTQSKPLNFQPRGMKAYFTTNGRTAYLTHNNYRWVRKADVSVLDHEKSWEAYGAERVRIVSNGLDCIVEKLK